MTYDSNYLENISSRARQAIAMKTSKTCLITLVLAVQSKMITISIKFESNYGKTSVYSRKRKSSRIFNHKKVNIFKPNFELTDK